jgi:hypothetical protein
VSPSQELKVARGVFATAVALSTVHYVDNTVRFDDYTGGKSGLVTRPMVPISWVLFTVAGIAGLVYLSRGLRSKAGPLLGVYSVSGLIGLAHFTTVSPRDFDWFQNTFITLDFLAGAAVLLLAVRITKSRDVSPLPTSSGRSPAGSASR